MAKELIQLPATVLTKAETVYYANTFASRILENGEEAEYFAAITKAEIFLDAIKKEIKANAFSTIARNKNISKLGIQLTVTQRNTCNFETCNDYMWNEMNDELTKLKEKMKARETFLKGIPYSPGFILIINPETGEETKVLAPLCTSTDVINTKW